MLWVWHFLTHALCSVIYFRPFSPRFGALLVLQHAHCDKHGHPTAPVGVVHGLGKFSTSVRGKRASQHSKLEQHLLRRHRRRFQSLRADVATSRNVHVGSAEYCTSKRCPRCHCEVDYARRKMRRGEWRGDPEELDKEGKAPMYRVLFCKQCDLYYHRDAAAAQNLAVLVESILIGEGRPPVFTSDYMSVSSL